jgi:hypothetical protein
MNTASNEKTRPPNLFLVDGHQIWGYELIKRRVSRANKYAGRVSLPAEWAGKAVKVVLGGEVIDDWVRAASNQGRLNVHHSHVGEMVSVIRVEA